MKLLTLLEILFKMTTLFVLPNDIAQSSPKNGCWASVGPSTTSFVWLRDPHSPRAIHSALSNDQSLPSQRFTSLSECTRACALQTSCTCVCVIIWMTCLRGQHGAVVCWFQRRPYCCLLLCSTSSLASFYLPCCVYFSFPAGSASTLSWYFIWC